MTSSRWKWTKEDTVYLVLFLVSFSVLFVSWILAWRSRSMWVVGITAFGTVSGLVLGQWVWRRRHRDG